MGPLLIFLGGGFGALSRWIISLYSIRFFNQAWMGTFFANSLGCIFLYLLLKLYGTEYENIDKFMRIGFLGALTTFSTLSFEVFDLLSRGKLFEGFGVFSINIVFGVGVGFIILRII